MMYTQHVVNVEKVDGIASPMIGHFLAKIDNPKNFP